uniref:U57-Eretoxin-Ek1a_1 n=1 Tax=Eresus cinnaberinus TaxID=175337 RepID=A0A2D0PDC6_ERECI
MHVFWVLLVAYSFTIATCDDDSAGALLDPKDMEAIQDRLAKMDFLELIFREIFGLKQNDARDDTCLPIGAECHFASGPNCCGLRTRCIVWDTQITAAYKGGPARWLSKCREYRLGVWLDDIGSWFSSWGK